MEITEIKGNNIREYFLDELKNSKFSPSEKYLVRLNLDLYIKIILTNLVLDNLKKLASSETIFDFDTETIAKLRAFLPDDVYDGNLYFSLCHKTNEDDVFSFLGQLSYKYEVIINEGGDKESLTAKAEAEANALIEAFKDNSLSNPLAVLRKYSRTHYKDNPLAVLRKYSRTHYKDKEQQNGICKCKTRKDVEEYLKKELNSLPISYAKKILILKNFDFYVDKRIEREVLSIINCFTSSITNSEFNEEECDNFIDSINKKFGTKILNPESQLVGFKCSNFDDDEYLIVTAPTLMEFIQHFIYYIERENKCNSNSNGGQANGDQCNGNSNDEQENGDQGTVRIRKKDNLK